MAEVKIGRFTRDMFTSDEAFEAAVRCQRQVHPELYAQTAADKLNAQAAADKLNAQAASCMTLT